LFRIKLYYLGRELRKVLLAVRAVDVLQNHGIGLSRLDIPYQLANGEEGITVRALNP
jgi:hypothetical protein